MCSLFVQQPMKSGLEMVHSVVIDLLGSGRNLFFCAEHLGVLLLCFSNTGWAEL